MTAVTPDEAAESLVSWVEKLDISKSGEYWAPRGPRKYLLHPNTGPLSLVIIRES